MLIKELRRSGSAKIKLDFAKSNTESTECYTKVSAYEERQRWTLTGWLFRKV